MRRINIRRGSVIPLVMVIGLSLGLTACGSDGTMTVGKALESCEKDTIANTTLAINQAVEKKAGARAQAFRDLELKDAPAAISAAREDLKGRVTSKDCTKGDSANTTDNPGDEVDLSATTKKSLMVGPEDLLPKPATCRVGDRLNRNSINGFGRWSDSVSTRFKASEPYPVYKELFAENCTNPTLLDMNIQALSQVKIGGFSVAEQNPWMGKFLKKAADPGLRSAYLTKKQDVNGVFVTAEFQRAAAMTNTLLMRFKAAGLVTERSTANWHLPGGGLVAGEFVRTKLNKKQEALPVFRFELTEKGQGCVYAIGFNKFDKRFERLSCEKLSTSGKPGKPDKPSTPDKPGNPGAPGGGCESNCNPPPKTPKCPPGSLKPECSPKSGNAADYKYPVGKKKVTESRPAESTPPKVVTTQPGGGGVVDTPTKTPASETGGQAPGATPAPSTPRPTPPNQGGTVGDNQTVDP